MLNQNWIVNFYSLSKGGNSQIRVAVDNLPNGIINRLSTHADLLITRESRKCERADLSAVQIKLLSNKINCAFKSNFLSKPQNVIFSPIIFSFNNLEN
jgi:hypothetical protein